MINEETANLAWSSQYGLALSVDVSKTTATVSVETADHEGVMDPVLTLTVCEVRALVDMLTVAMHMLERREKDRHDAIVESR
jgi:hypothetical protein